MYSCIFLGGVVGDLTVFSAVVVVDNNLQRVFYNHNTSSVLVEVFSYAMLKQGCVNFAVCLCNADTRAKVFYCIGRIATFSHTAEGRHTRVVPTVYYPFFNKLFQISLAHDSTGEV